VKPTIWLKILEFLYTGTITNSHGFDQNSAGSVSDLLAAAEQYQCSHLVDICRNIVEQQEFLNPSIGTYLNDANGNRLMELFFNKSLFSDVLIVLPDGTNYYGHKCLIGTRSTQLKDLISDKNSPKKYCSCRKYFERSFYGVFGICLLGSLSNSGKSRFRWNSVARL